jgi:hypothetical protein
MLKVRNRLNQSLSIGETTIPAGGSIEVEKLDADMSRLEAKGHIRVFREATKETAATKKAETVAVAEPKSVPAAPVVPATAEGEKPKEKK